MSEDTPIARDAVFAALVAQANGLTIKIGPQRLSEQLGCSNTTAAASLRWLDSQGWIKIVNPAMSRRAGTYRIIPEESRMPKQRALASLATAVWPLKALEQLIALWSEGCDTAEIGRRTGYSKNAVIGKAHRLIDYGLLENRADPVIRTGPREASQTRPSRAFRAPPVTLPPLPSAVAEPPALAPLPRLAPTFRPGFNFVRPIVAPRFEPIPRPVQLPRRVAATGSRMECQWPHGEPGVKGFHFCGAQSEPGRPYCEDHVKIAYVVVRDRREDEAA